MQMESAGAIIADYNSLKGMRGVWEEHWEEVALYVFPKQRGFITKETAGERRTEKIYDSTPIRANNQFAAILEAMLTPRNQKWHKLTPEDPTLEQSIPVKQYFEEVNDILFRARYRAKAQFASTQHETYLSLGAFGTGCKFIEDTLEGIRYSSVYLGDLCIKVDSSGLIDTVYRKLTLTARQAKQQFGEELSDKVANCENPNKEFAFIHCVAPNKDYDGEKQSADSMKFKSYYIDMENKNFVSTGGYTTMPYIVSRYTVSPTEIYGRGPAMEALPDIKMLNQQSKTDIRSAHLATDPPILLHDDLANAANRIRAGKTVLGGLNSDGSPLAKPFSNGGNLNISEIKMEQRRKSINESFLIDRYQMIVDNPNMTATQVMEIAQQKGMLMSPAMGRLQSEDLALTIERELDILSKLGMLPPLPDELREKGVDFKIEYDSPLSRAQKSEDVLGIIGTYEIMERLAPLDPTIVDNFDVSKDMKIIAEARGHPAKSMNSKEVIAEKREERQKAQAMQQMAEQAPPLAQAGKDINEMAQQ